MYTLCYTLSKSIKAIIQHAIPKTRVKIERGETESSHWICIGISLIQNPREINKTQIKKYLKKDKKKTKTLQFKTFDIYETTTHNIFLRSVLKTLYHYEYITQLYTIYTQLNIPRYLTPDYVNTAI